MTKARKDLAKLQGAEYPRARRQRQSTADGLPVLGTELRLAATECVFLAGWSVRERTGRGQAVDKARCGLPTTDGRRTAGGHVAPPRRRRHPASGTKRC